jgi:hypothetical protein
MPLMDEIEAYLAREHLEDAWYEVSPGRDLVTNLDWLIAHVEAREDWLWDPGTSSSIWRYWALLSMTLNDSPSGSGFWHTRPSSFLSIARPSAPHLPAETMS